MLNPLIFILFCLFTTSVSASDFNANEMDWFTMFMWLTGGLALFLYGMEQLVKGLLIVAGKQMKNLLAKLTTNRVMGAVTGAGVTAVIQSSSVTSVLTVGFVSAGLMSLSQAAGVIMGANLGTTITAQVIAFKVTNFALLMVAVGFAIQFFAKLNKKIALGRLIMGLGLIFFGMNVMSEGMAPLRDYQPFLDVMQQLQNPLLGILAGFIFTALIQSSSATIGIIIVMASNGFLTLPAGIALAMGANIGTTVTALLSTIGKSREAIRAGLIHLQFNMFGVLIMLPFIGEIAELSVYISSQPFSGNDVTMAILAENTPREIANANTIFNLINLIIFLPLIPLFLWIANRVIPFDDNEKDSGEFSAKYLDESLISTPALAMDAVTLELGAYQKHNGLFYKRVIGLLEKPNIDKVAKEDFNLKRLKNYENKILSYLGRVGQAELSAEEQKRFIDLMTVMNHLESMSDVYDTHLFAVLHKLIHEGIEPSETMMELVGQLATEVGKAMNNAIKAIVEKDNEAALSVLAVKKTVDYLIQEGLKHQVRRFKPNEERLNIFRIEMQLVHGFKQFHTLSKRIAKIQIESDKVAEVKEQNPDSEKVD